MSSIYVLKFLLALLVAPLLPGIISRVKALMAGRKGKPLLQTYFDLARLLRKGEVVSTASTWVFSLAPSIILACTIGALALLPLSGSASPWGFVGDFVLAAYLLGMARFSLMAAALDTGSSFEGMGASREATFSALAEPGMFLGFLLLASVCLGLGKEPENNLSLSAMFGGVANLTAVLQNPEFLLAPLVFFILLLAENCRIPVDDPTTHLELTMIHEVMILDHSGPNLAFLIYAASLKLLFFCSLVAALLIPPLPLWQGVVAWLAGITLVAVLTGIVESTLARLRMYNVPGLLGLAAALGALGLIIAQV